MRTTKYPYLAYINSEGSFQQTNPQISDCNLEEKTRKSYSNYDYEMFPEKSCFAIRILQHAPMKVDVHRALQQSALPETEFLLSTK